jgi:hypothetical protein
VRIGRIRFRRSFLAQRQRRVLRALRSDHVRPSPTDRRLFRFATLAASLPRATRVRFGRCAIVHFRFAAAADFLTFRRATAFVQLSYSYCSVQGLGADFGVAPYSRSNTTVALFSREPTGMRGATDYDDKRALKNPVNQVVAVVSSETDPQKVISAEFRRPG